MSRELWRDVLTVRLLALMVGPQSLRHVKFWSPSAQARARGRVREREVVGGTRLGARELADSALGVRRAWRPGVCAGQPSSKNRWKAAVADAARDAWPVDVLPLTGAVSLTLTYFHDGAPLDADNMIKPTQDALIGTAIVDDGQVKDVHASLRDLNGRYEVRSLRPWRWPRASSLGNRLFTFVSRTCRTWGCCRE